MADLDYALLCDYVRVEDGLAHVVAAGIDTISKEDVPSDGNVGLLLRLAFAESECGKPHRVDVIFRTDDGEQLNLIVGVVTPEWPEGLPAEWTMGAMTALNVEVPLPRFGEYAFEILVAGRKVKTIPLRAIRRESSE